LAQSLAPDESKLLLVPDEVNFTRNTAWLRDWLMSHEVKLYYSFNYIVDVRCPVPYIFTIYDLIRIKYPEYSYSDESFRQKFGEQEFAEINLDLAALAGSSPSGLGKQVFTNYFRAIMKDQAAKSLRIVTVSEAVKLDLVQLLNISPEKVSVVPAATYPEKFYRRQPAEVAASLEKINYRPGDPYCLFVGAKLPHKRLPWLIEVLHTCAAALPPNSKLLVTGKCRANDPALKHLIQDYKLEDTVIFTHEVSDDDLACLYSGAQALVVASVDEGFCLPALEALCCGCEVIAPALKVMSEITDDCAHFYPTHDAEKLASCLTDAFHDRLPRKAQDFRSRFSWGASAQRLAGILQQALSEARLR
jgi:glycosyltransferase involved in cell wall biosynthesis